MNTSTDNKRLYLILKGWTPYTDAYGFHKWVSPDETANLRLDRAVAVQGTIDGICLTK